MGSQRHEPAGTIDATGKHTGGQFRPAEAKDKGVMSFSDYYSDSRPTVDREWSEPSGVGFNAPCPWGSVLSFSQLAVGIDNVAAEMDSGLKLSPERNDAMPDRFRRKDGWYGSGLNESCLPMLVFFDDIGDFISSLGGPNKIEIKQRVKDYFPYDYEHVTGEVIPDKKSLVKRQDRFFLENKNNFVEYAAEDLGDGMTVRVFACRGGRHKNRSSSESRVYDVPIDYYDARPEFGMVIIEGEDGPVGITGRKLKEVKNG